MPTLVQPVTRGKGRGSGRRRGLVLAARGRGWSLWVPSDLWDTLTDKERSDMANRQAALLDQGQGG
jgi:hypothetical protein